jgi:hypothetical protein
MLNWLKAAEWLIENRYTVCVNDDLQTKSIDHTRKQEYDILQVLGVRIDMFGRGALAEPFIRKSIIRFAEKYDVEDIEKMHVMCLPFINEKKKKDVILYLYEGNDYKEQIVFADLFNEEDFEMPQV